MKERIAAVVRTKTRAEWEAQLGGTDVCFAPVYRFGEAHEHPHNQARNLFVPAADGSVQVAPAPRFSRTVAEPGEAYAYPGVDTDAVLGEFGFATDDDRRSPGVRRHRLSPRPVGYLIQRGDEADRDRQRERELLRARPPHGPAQQR